MSPSSRPGEFSLSPVSATVRNGLKVFAVPRSELPLVSIHLVLGYGAESDPSGKGGLADLAAEMFTLGTKTRSALQLAEEIDGLGATLSAGAGWDATSLHIHGLKEDLDRLLNLLLEIATEPAFAADEFAQLQQRRLAALVQQKDESQIVAHERFEEILFRGTPYDHPVYGTLKTLPLISAEDVRDFYRERFLPRGSFLVFAGDLDPENCFRSVEAQFPAVRPGAAAAPASTSPALSAPKTLLINRPDLTQSQIRLGHLGIPHAHPDYHSFEVMNYILGGGGFSSRLMKKIRVELGYTYGIRSSLEPRKYWGPFSIASFTPTENTAKCVHEIISVIQLFMSQGASGQEREEALRFLMGSYPFKFETLAQTAQRIIQGEVHGLGLDHLTAYPDKIAAVRQEDIFDCARKHIDPGKMVRVIVGRAEAFRRDLENWGPVEIQE